MMDIMPLLRHLNKLDAGVSDVVHLLAEGFAQAVIDHCLEQGFLHKGMCDVITLIKEGLDQVVFDELAGVPC